MNNSYPIIESVIGSTIFEKISNLFFLIKNTIKRNNTLQEKIDFSKKFWEKTINKLKLIIDKLNFSDFFWIYNFDGNFYFYDNKTKIPTNNSSLLWVIIQNFENNLNIKISKKEKLLLIILLRLIFYIPYSWINNNNSISLNNFNIFESYIKDINFSSKFLSHECNVILSKLYFIQYNRINHFNIDFNCMHSSNYPQFNSSDEYSKEMNIRNKINNYLESNIYQNNFIELEYNSNFYLKKNCLDIINKLNNLLNNTNINDSYYIEFVNKQIQYYYDEIKYIDSKN
jgi:hypothetical protein